eukprot:c22462_g1_i1 orf=483-992(-)
MNKPGAGGPAGSTVGVGALGGTLGTGVGAGPTAAAAAAAVQRQRTLLQRADTDIASLVDNFSHLLKAARINDAVRNAQEVFQMEVHAARMVQAADSLLKLVSELKQTAVFSDFASLNEDVKKRVNKFGEKCEDTKHLISSIGEQAAISLRDLESHYYLSLHKNSDFGNI